MPNKEKKIYILVNLNLQISHNQGNTQQSLPYSYFTYTSGIIIPPPNEVGGGYTGFTLSVRPSVRPSVRLSVDDMVLMVAIGKSLLIFSDVTFKMAAWRPYCIFFGFRTLTLLWLWISTSNFSGTILMYMGWNLLIFNNVIFKMAAWRPY